MLVAQFPVSIRFMGPQALHYTRKLMCAVTSFCLITTTFGRDQICSLCTTNGRARIYALMGSNSASGKINKSIDLHI